MASSSSRTILMEKNQIERHSVDQSASVAGTILKFGRSDIVLASPRIYPLPRGLQFLDYIWQERRRNHFGVRASLSRIAYGGILNAYVTFTAFAISAAPST